MVINKRETSGSVQVALSLDHFFGFSKNIHFWRKGQRILLWPLAGEKVEKKVRQ